MQTLNIKSNAPIHTVGVELSNDEIMLVSGGGLPFLMPVAAAFTTTAVIAPLTFAFSFGFAIGSGINSYRYTQL